MTRIQAIIRSGACALLLVCGFTFPVWAQGALAANDGSVLPFPLVPSASVAAETFQVSKHQRRVQPNKIVIILLAGRAFAMK
jgi:hypothetical protein